MGKGQDKVARSLVEFQPSAILDFYLLYFNIVDKEGLFLAFHPGSNFQQPIIWQGTEYLPMPVETEGFELSTNNRLVRPKIRISNKDFIVTDILANNKDLQYARLVRKRTFVKFLDDDNFDGGNPWGEADVSAEISNDTYIVAQKTAENRLYVEFELTTALDIDGATLNNKLILSNYCGFNYRGFGCRYEGAELFDKDNNQINVNNTSLINFIQQDQYNFLQWFNGESYKSGDMVWTVDKRINLTPIYGQKTSKYQETYHVCIKDHSSDQTNSPWSKNNSIYWIKDECAKNLTACKKRFNKTPISKTVSDVFPITEKYLNTSGLASSSTSSSINGLKFLQQDQSLPTYIDKDFTIATWITDESNIANAASTVFTTLKTGAYWGGGLLYYLMNGKFVQVFSTVTQNTNTTTTRFEEIGSLNGSAYTNGLYNGSYGVYEGSRNSIDLSLIKTGDTKELLFSNQQIGAWKTGDFIKGYYKNHSLEGIVTEINISNNLMYSTRFVAVGVPNITEGIGTINENTIQKTITTSTLEKRHRPLPLEYNTVDNSLVKVKIRVTTNSSPTTMTTDRFGVIEKPAFISWAAASAEAQSLGGRLAVLNTQEKNNIVPIFNGYKLIGGNDVANEGIFRWINGEYVKQGYQNWESIPANISQDFLEPNDGVNTAGVRVVEQPGQDYMYMYGNDRFSVAGFSGYKKWDDGVDSWGNGYIIEYPWMFENQTNNQSLSDVKWIYPANSIKKGTNNYNLLLMEGKNTQSAGGKIKISLINTDGENSSEYTLAANEKFTFSHFLHQKNHDKFPADPDYSTRFRLGLTDWYYADNTTNPATVNKNGFNAPKGLTLISEFKKFLSFINFSVANIGVNVTLGGLAYLKKNEHPGVNFNSWKSGDYIEIIYPYEDIVVGGILSIVTNSSTQFIWGMRVIYRSVNVVNTIPTSEIITSPTNWIWTNAKADAEARNGRLFCAKNSDDWTTITNRHSSLMSTTRCWIGATDSAKEGEWRWVDGTLFYTGNAALGGAVSGLYTNWSLSEPNNASLPGFTIPGEHYAHTYQQSDGGTVYLKWNDLPNDPVSIKSYILERPMTIKVYTTANANDTRGNSYTSPINYHGLSIWGRELSSTEKDWLKRTLNNDMFSNPSVGKLPRKFSELPLERPGLNVTSGLIGWWQDDHTGVLSQRGGSYKWKSETGNWSNGDQQKDIIITGVGISTTNLEQTYQTTINRNLLYTKTPNYYLPFGGFPGTYGYGYGN